MRRLSATSRCCWRSAQAARSLSAATASPRGGALVGECGLQCPDRRRRTAASASGTRCRDRGDGRARHWQRLALPAGPLRECPARIAEAHALVLNGDAPVPQDVHPQRIFRMRLAGDQFHNLHDPQRTCGAEDLARPAIASAGRHRASSALLPPARAGWVCRRSMQAFPDHHVFQPSDLALAGADALLMTEKDAVKCQAFAPPETWVLPVEAQLDPDLAQWVVEKLNGQPPA
jgi:tetraacyldisaccharide 4'-kinase